jgi:hypothetical protein
MSLKETALALAKGHRLGVALFFLLLPSFAVALSSCCGDM